MCVCLRDSVVTDYLDMLRALPTLCRMFVCVCGCVRVCVCVNVCGVLPLIHEESSSSSISSSSQDVRVTSKEKQRPLTLWPQFMSEQGKNPLATATSTTTTMMKQKISKISQYQLHNKSIQGQVMKNYETVINYIKWWQSTGYYYCDRGINQIQMIMSNLTMTVICSISINTVSLTTLLFCHH